ncbi:MAG: hypothetical protein COX16_08090 [Deltaproteobacteria bacterium CG23_combo_of_CG06-09_8_20_14_all_51_20]|nr:hypothetical protein [bacterium]OIP38225.1 MAG: hypothetical protein AUK25_13225 [Desulfobacteraceae bacterium CG2_30_51_40]PIP46758.1 MAG: hypothetical protein COX16_08090 [Deltaproteobacteria bacterium CG23_combo_of_CG06-09_8_20_14_all_51_20]PIW01516.1 MAG: hypothetical protein COW41_02340 [Deltaproteobacteria bacterium CG17_big_fil_post_rev_8_21_14_2_50_51_6]PIY22202.1 MAG: hypothetical protein COZ11_13585 [Deltaproteobacteria bacterium CG_4_10_14_3_um_filter_51_14]PJB37899.1 MAG: hypoth
MGWRVTETCPQCGGLVTMEENGRLFSCPFCGVRHAVIWPDLPSYAFAGRYDGGFLFLAPYLRFKGNIFTCREDAVLSRVVDVSVKAFNLDQAPFSLGMRTQSMRISFAPEASDACYLGSYIEVSEVLRRAVNSMPERDPGFHRAFLGEVISRIYLPLLLDGKVLRDGLSGKELGTLKGGAAILDGLITKEAPRRPMLVPALCPECASDLTGEAMSLVFVCGHCGAAWETAPAGLTRIQVFFAECTKTGSLNLPFWRIEAGISVPGQTVNGDMPELLTTWTPAFKIRPDLFLSLARRLTSSTVDIGLTQDRLGAAVYFPVTLPAREAIQALKVILYKCSVKKKIIGPLLSGMKVTPRAIDLCYLPFDQSGYDLVCLCLPLAVNKNSLKFGRSL